MLSWENKKNIAKWKLTRPSAGLVHLLRTLGGLWNHVAPHHNMFCDSPVLTTLFSDVRSPPRGRSHRNNSQVRYIQAASLSVLPMLNTSHFEEKHIDLLWVSIETLCEIVFALVAIKQLGLPSSSMHRPSNGPCEVKHPSSDEIPMRYSTIFAKWTLKSLVLEEHRKYSGASIGPRSGKQLKLSFTIARSTKNSQNVVQHENLAKKTKQSKMKIMILESWMKNTIICSPGSAKKLPNCIISKIWWKQHENSGYGRKPSVTLLQSTENLQKRARKCVSKQYYVRLQGDRDTRIGKVPDVLLILNNEQLNGLWPSQKKIHVSRL